jgi:hypothetical protein
MTKEERSAYYKDRYQKNKARIAEKNKAKRAARSEEQIAADNAKKKARRDARSEEQIAADKAQGEAWRIKNKVKFLDQKKAYYQKNREKIMARDKVYRDTHKEECAARNKAYHQKNREKIRAYWQSPAGRKARIISQWKGYGIICDDWDALYERYITTLLCEQCNVELTTDRYNTETTRTLDHNHDTLLFRNVLCHSCNVRRDVRRKARSAAERYRIGLRTDLSC